MSTSLRIAAPPRATFDYLSEPRNRAQWQSSLRGVDVLTDGPTGVGTRWLDRTTLGVSPRLEITVMEPPGATTSGATTGRWTEVGHWRGVTAALTLTFAPVAGDPDATDVGVHFDLSGAGAWRLPARALRALAPPAVHADLRRAARIIEAGGAAGRGADD